VSSTPSNSASSPSREVVRSLGSPAVKHAVWLAPSAGLLASLGAHAWLPLPTTDPLRGTLAVLPAIIGALWAIACRSRRRGGLRIPLAVSATELVVAMVLALLALRRESLDIPYGAELLFAAFAALLGHRVAQQLRALRPLLGFRVPSRPSVLFFALPCTVYLALLPWSSFHRPPDGDEPWYLLITHSLAYDGDAELTNQYENGDWRHFLDRPIAPQPGDPRGPDGEVYSRHNELLPLLLAPAYRLAGRTGALVMMAIFTAALAWTSLRLARRYFPVRPGPALLAYALVAFTPPLLLYSYQVWVEIPAALLAAAALDRVLAPGGWGRKKWFGVGAPLMLLPLLKIRLLMLAGPLLLMAWLFAGRPRKPLVILGALLAVLGGGILGYNQIQYGNPLKVHSLQEIAFYDQPLRQYALGLSGFFWDSAFGLFASAPLWLLLLPAGVLLVRHRHPLAAHLAAFALPYLALVAPRSEWYGGWCPPFRYALVTLPLLGVALIPLLARRRAAGARALLAALGALTLALTLLWLVFPGWTYNFADGRTYLLDALSQHFDTDIARLFPSSVRPRTATWVWPLASLLLVPLWFLPRRTRLRAAASWGLAGLLLAMVAMPVLARRLPTAVVEFEDPQVQKTGGHVEPERWTFDRTRFRGAWVLRPGEHLAAPIAPGSGGLTATLHVRFVQNRPGPLRLEWRAGERLLAETLFEADRSWEERVVSLPGPWDAGQLLILAVAPEDRTGRPSGVLLDRVELAWR
jgi:hypothetical protein